MTTKKAQEVVTPDAEFLMALFSDEVDQRVVFELLRENDTELVIKRLLARLNK